MLGAQCIVLTYPIFGKCFSCFLFRDTTFTAGLLRSELTKALHLCFIMSTRNRTQRADNVTLFTSPNYSYKCIEFWTNLSFSLSLQIQKSSSRAGLLSSLSVHLSPPLEYQLQQGLCCWVFRCRWRQRPRSFFCVQRDEELLLAVYETPCFLVGSLPGRLRSEDSWATNPASLLDLPDSVIYSGKICQDSYYVICFQASETFSETF